MLIGTSGAKGILIYDTLLDKENNAVYGYYENEDIKIIKGNNKELRIKQKEDDKPYEKKNNFIYKLMFISLVVAIIFVTLSIIYLPLLYTIATIFFCVTSYFPILIIIYACSPIYKNKEIKEQFKRFHGAEHAIIFLLHHDKELTLENIKKELYFDGECGSAYAQSAIILISAICYVIIKIVYLGIIKSIFIVLITILLLLANIFNKYNPLFLIQKFVVSKPTDREYELALKAAEVLKRNPTKEV